MIIGTYVHGARSTSEGTYDDGSTCVPCDTASVECVVPGTTLATLTLLPNRWRLSNRTARTYKCTGHRSEETPCVGGNSSAGYCGANLTGPLCRSCESEYEYFDRSSGACLSCATTGLWTLVLPTLMLTALGVIAWLLLLLWRELQLWRAAEGAIGTLRQLSLTAARLGLGGKAKVLLAYWQIVLVMPQAFDVSLPVQYARILEAFAFPHAFPRLPSPSLIFTRLRTGTRASSRRLPCSTSTR